MLFRQLFDEETWTYTYLIADGESHEAVLIDPVKTQVDRDTKLLGELGLKLIYAIDTHVHADHITGLGDLRERTGCKTGVSANGNVDCIDMNQKEGDILTFGKHKLHVLETPGHTNTCLSFVCENIVFTGDSLLIRGCGRSDFQQGNAGKLYDSITQKLYALPDDTHVYPGHDYRGMTQSTIGEEKLYNPRINLGREGFIEFMNNLNLPDPKKIHEAVPANLACGQPEQGTS